MVSSAFAPPYSASFIDNLAAHLHSENPDERVETISTLSGFSPQIPLPDSIVAAVAEQLGIGVDNLRPGWKQDRVKEQALKTLKSLGERGQISKEVMMKLIQIREEARDGSQVEELFVALAGKRPLPRVVIDELEHRLKKSPSKYLRLFEKISKASRKPPSDALLEQAAKNYHEDPTAKQIINEHQQRLATPRISEQCKEKLIRVSRRAALVAMGAGAITATQMLFDPLGSTLLGPATDLISLISLNSLQKRKNMLVRTAYRLL